MTVQIAADPNSRQESNTVVKISATPRFRFAGIDDDLEHFNMPASPRVQLAPAQRNGVLIKAPAPVAVGETLGDLKQRADAEHDRATERQLKTITQIIAQGCVEAELGLRSLQQLSRWMFPEVYEKMRLRSEITQDRLTQTSAMVRPFSSRVNKISAEIFETSTSIKVGDRLRAIAMRLEKHRSRWLVSAIEIG